MVIYPAWCSLSFLDPWLVGWHLFGRNSQLLLLQIFLLFLSFFSFFYGCPFVVVPQFLDILFWSFFPLCFSVLEVSIDIFSSSKIVSSAMSSLLMSPSDTVRFCYSFWSLALLLDSFLEFHLCWNCPSALACCLLYPLGPLAY